MTNAGKDSCDNMAWRASIVAALSVLVLLYDIEWWQRHDAGGSVAMVVSGALLIALLGVVAVPLGRFGIHLGVPSEGAVRLMLAAFLVLALIPLGLGFAARLLGPADRYGMMTLDVLLGLVVTGCGFCHILDTRLPAQFAKRVAGLHVLVACGLLVAAVAQDPPELDFDRWLVLAIARGLGALVFVTLMAFYVRKQRVPPGHCPMCRYNLTGNVSGQCPECGTPVPAGTQPAHGPGLKQELLRNKWAVVCGALAALHIVCANKLRQGKGGIFVEDASVAVAIAPIFGWSAIAWYVCLERIRATKKDRGPGAAGTRLFIMSAVSGSLAGLAALTVVPPEALRGTYLNVGLVVPSWALAVAAVLATRRHRRTPGRCPRCAGDLTGNVSGRCPECGTPIAAGTAPAEAPEVKNAG